jgi:hypothetical protein
MAPVSEWLRENRFPSCYAATGGLFQKNLFCAPAAAAAIPPLSFDETGLCAY